MVLSLVAIDTVVHKIILVSKSERLCVLKIFLLNFLCTLNCIKFEKTIAWEMNDTRLCLKRHWINLTYWLCSFVVRIISTFCAYNNFDACRIEEASWIISTRFNGKQQSNWRHSLIYNAVVTAHAVNGYLTVATKAIHCFATVKNVSLHATCQTQAKNSQHKPRILTLVWRDIHKQATDANPVVQDDIQHDTTSQEFQSLCDMTHIKPLLSIVVPKSNKQTINTQFSTWHKQSMNAYHSYTLSLTSHRCSSWCQNDTNNLGMPKEVPKWYKQSRNAQSGAKMIQTIQECPKRCQMIQAI